MYNHVLIILDDSRWTSTGVTQSIAEMEYTHDPAKYFDKPIYTPHLDNLMQTGAWFWRAHVMAPICRPSIRSFLTGVYLRHMHTIAKGDKIDLDIHTLLSHHMAEMGFYGLHCGKWYEPDPKTLGFAESDEGWHQSTPDIFRATLEPIPNFLDRMKQVQQPWWIYCMPKLPHSPFGGWPDDIAIMYEGDGDKKYKRNMTYADRRIGEIIQKLDETGLREKTIIWVWNDNGTGLPGPSKNSFGENGMRTFLIANGPGIIPQRYNYLINVLDMGKTMLDYAGVQPPAWEGTSFRPLLEGQPQSWQQYLFEQAENAGKIAIQNFRWKIYVKTDNEEIVQAYDLLVDPFEERNLWNGARTTPYVADAAQVMVPILLDWWRDG